MGNHGRKLVNEMLAGSVGDYGESPSAGLRAVLDMWMLASADDLVLLSDHFYFYFYFACLVSALSVVSKGTVMSLFGTIFCEYVQCSERMRLTSSGTLCSEEEIHKVRAICVCLHACIQFTGHHTIVYIRHVGRGYANQCLPRNSSASLP